MLRPRTGPAASGEGVSMIDSHFPGYMSMAGLWRFNTANSFHAAGPYALAITMPIERDDPGGYTLGQSITLLDGTIVEWRAEGQFDGKIVDAGFLTVALTRGGPNALVNHWACPS